MQERRLERALENAESVSSRKAIQSRISRAHKVEEVLGIDLDRIVIDDRKMYDALITLKTGPYETNGNLQNALRWYYKTINSKEFPRLSYFR